MLAYIIEWHIILKKKEINDALQMLNLLLPTSPTSRIFGNFVGRESEKVLVIIANCFLYNER